jgi:GxxExxY protein
VRNGLSVETEKPIAVYYEDKVVGTFSADLVIEGRIILELKSADLLHASHEAQLINYLRATEIELGFVFNFGKQAEFRRKYFSNKNKRRIVGSRDDGILESLFRKDDPPKSA